MKQQVRLLERMVGAMDLNTEALPNVPLVELVGNHRVLVENHLGVIHYGCDEIGIKVDFGEIRILGANLELTYMSKQQLIITGSISSAQMCRRK